MPTRPHPAPNTADLSLVGPTAGVDVGLRRDMWKMVRDLRKTGVTIILTTHYIEEAEEMADRVGVIAKGKLVLVEEKNALMQKMGKKRLIVTLVAPMEKAPEGFTGVTLEDDGKRLVYTYDARGDSRIGELLAMLDFSDLETKQSSLEEIFVSLVHQEKAAE